MSGRKPNPQEQKLHQAALADPKKTLSHKECEALIPDSGTRTAAINFLLGTGLFKALKDAKGTLSFRAVQKKELEVKKDMSDEESLVLSHIQAAANEGIWTKHLKAKTELHQTVIDRCIKSLVQKQLIKNVKSVKFPTRKIYMLSHLEPTVEMTGGPWYTDNELDTEFIKLLCSASLRFIRDRSTPKQKNADADEQTSQLLYPISAAPQYPTAQQILTFLSKSRITETQLDVEHVEMLLNVLVLDGEIEKVPAYGASMWDATVQEEPDSDNDRSNKKRKRKEADVKKRKRSRRSKSDTESDSESEEERTRKKTKKRKKSKETDSEASATESESERKKKKKKRRKTKDSDEDSESESEDEPRKKKSKKKSKKRRSHSESDTDEDTDSEDEDDRRSRSKSKSRSKSRSRKHSPSPADDFSAFPVEEDYSAFVYRAVRQERVAFGLAQTPCVRCPTFDFCKDKGPVNPQDCVYYEEWLKTGPVARETM